MKKLFFAGALCGVLILGGVSFAQAADIIISEIMYDVPGTDSGYEWIELHNTSDTAIDIAEWHILENDVQHAMSLESGSSSVVMPGDYVVVASNSEKFIEAHSSFAGVLFDSVFSLNNQGESLSLTDIDEQTKDTVYYTPQDAANGTGNSLQYTGSSWIAASETPAIQNHTTPSDVSDDDDTTSGSVANTSSSLGSNKKPKETFDPYYTGELEFASVVVAGVEVELDFILTHYRPNKRPTIKHSGEFIWSMGDGSTYATQWEEPVPHTYQYPGSYVVFIEYHRSEIMPEPAFVFEKTVVVHAADISVAEVTAGGDIRIDSNNPRVTDISGWRITYLGKTFTFPPNTYLPANESRYVSAQIHGLDNLGPDKTMPLVLERPSGQEHVRVVPAELTHKTQAKEGAPPKSEELLPDEEQETQGQDIEIERSVPEVVGDSSPGIGDAAPPMMWVLLGVGVFCSLVTLGGLWWVRRREKESERTLS